MAPSLYFAYGSNLNVPDFDSWCVRNRHPAGLIRPIGIGRLGDQKLSFSHRSTTRRGGALNLEPHPGGVVEGMLFEVDRKDGWKALDQKEGAPSVYQQVETEVMLDDAAEATATAYIVPEPLADHFDPTDDYIETVTKGLAAFGLGTQALRAAAKNTAPPLFTDAVFVYGTLMRGEERFEAMNALEIQCVANAVGEGILLDTGCGYPALVHANRSEATPPTADRVVGEFIRIADVGKGLKRLDTIEGFQGFGESGSLYVRRLAQVIVDLNQAHWAWLYRFASDVTGFDVIPSGCWRTHRKSSSLE